jgi:hypothetical protein
LVSQSSSIKAIDAVNLIIGITILMITLANLTILIKGAINAIKIKITLFVLIDGPVVYFLTVFFCKKMLLENAINSHFSFIFPL